MFPYTKILEVPIVLHKKINDEDFEQFELPNKKILLVHLNDEFNYEKHFELEY